MDVPPAFWQHGGESDCPTDDCAATSRGRPGTFFEQPVAKNTQDQRINALLDYLRQHLHEPHNLDELAQR
jgi:transcriptional regulator GlxA family with amidase domain